MQLRQVDFIVRHHPAATLTQQVTDLLSQLKAAVREWQTDESLRKCPTCGWVAPPQ